MRRASRVEARVWLTRVIHKRRGGEDSDNGRRYEPAERFWLDSVKVASQSASAEQKWMS